MQSVITSFDGAMEALKGFLASPLESMTGFFNVFSNFWLGTVLITAIFLCLAAISIRRYGAEFSGTIKSPKTLALCAMLVAVNVILGYYTIQLSAYVRIGFGFVTVPVVSMLFGPLVGCCMGIVQDIVSFIIKPTGGLLINLTMTAGMTGIIYAAAFYKKRITFVRVLLAQLFIIVVINICLNSIALAPTVASGMVGILPSRIIKNILLLPVQTVLIYAILKTVQTRIKGSK